MNRLPNVVLVVFDAARRDRFGCYGYERPTTPTVDRLTAEGLRVETMISNGTWTPPSHGSLFTGLYPTQHGNQWQTGLGLRPTVEVTMAEWFKRLGYETTCATNNGLITAHTGLTRGFDNYAFRLDLERGVQRWLRRAKKGLGTGDSGGGIVNRWIGRWLARANRPFFLFVNYVECHWSYAPPLRHERRVGGPRFGYLENVRYRWRVAGRLGPWEAIARAGERERAVYSTMYDAELATADGHLRDLLKRLTASGHLDGETLVIVTSDHGEHIGEHGLADHHASLDDHLIRVPFVAWGPGLIPTGVQTGLYEFVDVLPSLAELARKPLDVDYLGGRRRDLFTQLRDASGNEYAFAEWRSWSENERGRLARTNPSYDFTGLGKDLVCVRDQDYKLVRSSDGEERLYDIAHEPDEETSVLADHPAIAERLRRALDDAVSSWGKWEQEPTDPLTEEEQREVERRLAALGYI